MAQSKQSRTAAMRSDFAVLGGGETANKIAVDKLIETLKGKTIRQRASHKQPPVVELPEPNIAVPEANIPAAAVPAAKVELISDEEVQRLCTLSKDANAVAEPAGVAEALYAAGRMREAALFYEIALGRKQSLGRDISDNDRAWMLLQIANCRADDPNAALKPVKELIAKYQDSVWYGAATAKRDLLLWYISSNPKSLIKRSGSATEGTEKELSAEKKFTTKDTKSTKEE
jgi:hypothetical protein